ncbi:NADPH-dependent FMN reductase [Demequina sp.]|uniref:NADPH-dependent FMN reductase n=1 Tax=Demequina sp. TaxID=2050685 RepID=UPI003D103F65
MRIGVIVGSLSGRSINRAVANHFGSVAPEGVEFVEIDWSQLPLYRQDLEADFPASALAFKQDIADADGIIIVTPEYSRSLPGALKNALDWAARPYGKGAFNGKPVAIMGVSGGPIGTAAAQQHLRAILGHYNAPTLGQPEVFLRFNAEDFAGGVIVNDATRAVLTHFLAATAAHVALHTREVATV